MAGQIPTSQVQDALVAQGVPASYTPAVLAAITALGQEFTPAGGGAAQAPLSATAGEVRAVAGLPGVLLKAARVGTTGWLVWIDITGKDGTVDWRAGPVYVASGATSIL